MKNNLIIPIVILIIIGIIFIPQILFSTYNATHYTGYTQATYTEDTITYTNIDGDSLTQAGFTEKHFASGNLGRNFDSGMNNKNLFKIYLKLSGYDPNDFNVGGSSSNCAFSGGEIDLSNIGFTYYPSPNCYIGTFNENILRSFIPYLTCFVEGTTTYICNNPPIGSSDRCAVSSINYNIEGIVSYESSNGYICEVDKSLLFNQVPSSFHLQTDPATYNRGTGLIGITATSQVFFTIKRTIDDNNTQLSCSADVKICPDGSYVSRDPNNNCQFKECSSGVVQNPESQNQCSFVSNFDIIHFTEDKCQNGLIFLFGILVPTILSIFHLFNRK